MIKYYILALNIFTSIAYSAGIYNGGDGSAENPYQINTPEQLWMIRDHREDLDKHFIVTDDLTLTYSEGDNEWKYLNIFYASVDHYFKGVFDGNNHIIKGLKLKDNCGGLFGYNGYVDREGGCIKNVILQDISYIEDNRSISCSILAGNNNGIIENCVVSDINFTFGPNYPWVSNVGLVKDNRGIIKNCQVNNVSFSAGTDINDIYGLAYNNYGTITGCDVQMALDSSFKSFDRIAGLVNTNYKTGIIENCTTDISFCGFANYYAGLAICNYGQITDCYVKSDIASAGGMWHVSGLVYDNGDRYKPDKAKIENCSVDLSYYPDEDKDDYFHYFSGVAGYSGRDNIIRQCNVVLDVDATEGTWGAGGIVQENEGQVIECYVTGNFVIPESEFGGIVHYNNHGKIFRCWTDLDQCIGDSTGGIVNKNEFGIVKNCFADGDVVSYGYQDVAGGIAAVASGSIISCYATGDVSVYHSDGVAGGIVGGSGGYVTNCYSTGTVLSNGIAGGAIGVVNIRKVSNCYSTGDVYAADEAGGFTGEALNFGIIENCFSTGSVYSNDCAGGFVGNYRGGRISKCYSTGKFIAEDGAKGGFVGRKTDNFYDKTSRQRIRNSYWDKDSFDIINNIGEGEIKGVEGLTTEELSSVEILRGKGWNINDSNKKSVWTISGIDYPQLTGFLPQTMAIDSINFEADNNRTGDIRDSVEIKGRLNVAKLATAVDIRRAMQDIFFRIEHSENDSVYGYSQLIPADDISVNKNADLLTYRASGIGITELRIDLNTAAFKVKISKVDFTGVKVPLEIELVCGDFSADCIAAETAAQYLESGAEVPHVVDVINGKNNIPIKMLDGIYDVLRVDLFSYGRGNISSPDYLTITGEISVRDKSIDIANEDVIITFGSYSLTLPVENAFRVGKRGAFRYKMKDGDNYAKVMALFDIDNYKYKIFVESAWIRSNEDPPVVSVSFGDFSEQVDVIW